MVEILPLARLSINQAEFYKFWLISWEPILHIYVPCSWLVKMIYFKRILDCCQICKFTFMTLTHILWQNVNYFEIHTGGSAIFDWRWHNTRYFNRRISKKKRDDAKRERERVEKTMRTDEHRKHFQKIWTYNLNRKGAAWIYCFCMYTSTMAFIRLIYICFAHQ